MLSLFLAGLQAVSPAHSSEFQWLAGHWVRDSEQRRSEEIWTSADGALMTGMSRSVRRDGRTSFEFMRIEFAPAAGGLPVFIAQPSGGEPVRFTYADGGAGWAVFANTRHDFPTHIEYAREQDALTARIWGPEGEEAAIEWRWRLSAE